MGHLVSRACQWFLHPLLLSRNEDGGLPSPFFLPLLTAHWLTLGQVFQVRNPKTRNPAVVGSLQAKSLRPPAGERGSLEKEGEFKCLFSHHRLRSKQVPKSRPRVAQNGVLI
ncbi:hypothetical protein AVEN_116613-1 [Araneus ventricosus]|uniref:Uncharacterized protein n=1 Tax=Araneus ventricosus TaxID=182803 RepID=A0A4Y2DDT8_ARAVE|nr:hypothetical protein AVEN_116613-1 [Araneus ventricosus]